MATYSVDSVEIFGRGVLKSEGVVVDKENNVYGGGRNGVMYKVNPEGKVSVLCTLPAGSIPNGVTMDRQGNVVYCDLGKKAMMRVTQSGPLDHADRRWGGEKARLPDQLRLRRTGIAGPLFREPGGRSLQPGPYAFRGHPLYHQR